MIMPTRARYAGMALVVLASLAPRVLFAQDTFGTLSSTHFDVKYQRGVPQEDARKVMDYLQTEYKSLSADLGMEPKTRIDVRIYESVGKFLEETTLKRPWRTALYQRGTLHLQPVSAMTQRKLFEKAIAYELALVFLEGSGQKGCPRWLIESFA
jgi:hypothetical protein